METTTMNKRLDNPGHKSKTEEEHISHVKERIKERFDLNISTEEYYELLDLVKNKSIQLYRLNTQNSVKLIKFKGSKMLVVYGCRSGRKELPSRIKTVLYPDAKYPVPDKLLRQEVNMQDFTEQIKDKIDEMILFSKTVMPTITPRELFTNSKYDNLESGFKKIVKHISSGQKTVKPETMLSMAASLVIRKYDNEKVLIKT